MVLKYYFYPFHAGKVVVDRNGRRTFWRNSPIEPKTIENTQSEATPSTFYFPPGLLPTATPLNTPRPGLTALAKRPSGGGLMADSGTSLIGVGQNMVLERTQKID